MRRVMIVLMVMLLLAVSIGIGVFVARWPQLGCASVAEAVPRA